jgi:hypothetical protein
MKFLQSINNNHQNFYNNQLANKDKDYENVKDELKQANMKNEKIISDYKNQLDQLQVHLILCNYF